VSQKSLLKVTNKDANDLRRTGSTRNSEAHISVVLREKSTPRNTNPGLTPRHHPVAGTPRWRVESLEKGMRRGPKPPEEDMTKGGEIGLSPLFVIFIEAAFFLAPF